MHSISLEFRIKLASQTPSSFLKVTLFSGDLPIYISIFLKLSSYRYVKTNSEAFFIV